jgi:hypothetical protein
MCGGDPAQASHNISSADRDNRLRSAGGRGHVSSRSPRHSAPHCLIADSAVGVQYALSARARAGGPWAAHSGRAGASARRGCGRPGRALRSRGSVPGPGRASVPAGRPPAHPAVSRASLLEDARSRVPRPRPRASGRGGAPSCCGASGSCSPLATNQNPLSLCGIDQSVLRKTLTPAATVARLRVGVVGRTERLLTHYATNLLTHFSILHPDSPRSLPHTSGTGQLQRRKRSSRRPTGSAPSAWPGWPRLPLPWRRVRAGSGGRRADLRAPEGG